MTQLAHSSTPHAHPAVEGESVELPASLAVPTQAQSPRPGGKKIWTEQRGLSVIPCVLSLGKGIPCIVQHAAPDRSARHPRLKHICASLAFKKLGRNGGMPANYQAPSVRLRTPLYADLDWCVCVCARATEVIRSKLFVASFQVPFGQSGSSQVWEEVPTKAKVEDDASFGFCQWPICQ